jgi:hypothetical protein
LGAKSPKLITGADMLTKLSRPQLTVSGEF